MNPVDTILPRQPTFDRLPPERSESLLPTIRRQLGQTNRSIVVLDDDPTGTQTVYDTPVLTGWSIEVLADEFSRGTPLFYVLTNSRALSSVKAIELAGEIGENLVQAAESTGRDFTVISRSDSTLRGHYPDEVNALLEATGKADAVHVIVPYFLQGGRFTIDDIHYVAEGDQLVPAAQTPFAKDAAFGFSHSNLIDWVLEKRGGTMDRSQVVSISLSELRHGSIDRLTERLVCLPSKSVCVVNAVSMSDIESFVLASMRAESLGKQMIYRTAASFVQAYAGLQPKPLLTARDIGMPNAAAGLIVAGSYVPKTTTQLSRLVHDAKGLSTVTLNVRSLLEGDATDIIQATLREVSEHLRAGQNVLLQTSRSLVTGSDAVSSLEIGNRISTAIVQVVAGIDVPLRYLVAKGGITSSDVATQSLEIKRAMVIGQLLPGVPVWRLQPESRFPGLPYIVFPGNVGDENSLLEAYQKLSDER
ncbi:four-carbon acid sugar kinase family protein [Novipirellula artificiosorum]|uniref:Hydroxyacid dehydrogenase n=1 Tax=Novipirellula artificiosorum TaxID=2528016 RepID=A0A5C6DMA0_9BACT|nr:four-carbon acid sugar kinase family protein [Novipirellula artificiosorum]TWU38473.1 hypothetical protein Poly41_29490 [Novipirellula artificiosorum]